MPEETASDVACKVIGTTVVYIGMGTLEVVGVTGDLLDKGAKAVASTYSVGKGVVNGLVSGTVNLTKWLFGGKSGSEQSQDKFIEEAKQFEKTVPEKMAEAIALDTTLKSAVQSSNPDAGKGEGIVESLTELGKVSTELKGNTKKLEADTETISQDNSRLENGMKAIGSVVANTSESTKVISPETHEKMSQRIEEKQDKMEKIEKKKAELLAKNEGIVEETKELAEKQTEIFEQVQGDVQAAEEELKGMNKSLSAVKEQVSNFVSNTTGQSLSDIQPVDPEEVSQKIEEKYVESTDKMEEILSKIETKTASLKEAYEQANKVLIERKTDDNAKMPNHFDNYSDVEQRSLYFDGIIESCDKAKNLVEECRNLMSTCKSLCS